MPHGEGGFSGGGTIFGSGGFGSGGGSAPVSSFESIQRLIGLGLDPQTTQQLAVLSDPAVLSALEGGERRETGVQGQSTILTGGILPPAPGGGGGQQQQQRQPSNTELSVLLAIEIIKALIQGRPGTPRITVNQFGVPLPPGSALPTTGAIGGAVPPGGGINTTGGIGMAMIPTFIGGIEQLVGLLPQILGQFGIGPSSNSAMPGGAPIFNQPTVAQPVGLPAQIAGGAASMAQFAGATCITPSVGTTLRLPSRVDVPSPDGRTFVTFRNMGRPVLWSGDFAAAKRVKRIAGRAKRRGGR